MLYVVKHRDEECTWYLDGVDEEDCYAMSLLEAEKFDLYHAAFLADKLNRTSPEFGEYYIAPVVSK